MSDNELLYLLAKARHLGADIRVVLTVEGDSAIFNHSNRVWANRLLEAGCRVYLYPGVLHTKALTLTAQASGGPDRPQFVDTGEADYRPFERREIRLRIARRGHRGKDDRL